MASTIWKGYVAFGMLSIPVRLAAAARSESIGFHMLHAGCNGRLEQKYYCKTCGKETSRADTVKGLEEGKDHYIIIDPAEIEQIAPASSTTMEIIQFVEAEEVDPVYFDASYYLEPEKVGRPAYKLLTEAMRITKRLAIAKLAMRQREHTVIVRPQGPGLTVHTVFYENEVRANDLNLSDVAIAEPHLALAQQLIESLAARFNPAEFHDAYEARLLELIESKRSGKKLEIVRPVEGRPTLDLAAALTQSLAARKPPAVQKAAAPAVSGGGIGAGQKKLRKAGIVLEFPHDIAV